MKVSIIIVYYRGKEKLLASLASIRKSRPKAKYEIIVVDNSPTPLSPLSLGGVRYLKSPQNLGYGAGNNLGASQAQGEYLFILNPDTKVFPGTIDELVGFLDKNKKVAMVAPNLLDKTGHVFPQLGSRQLTPLRGVVALSFLNKIFPNNPISKKYWLSDASMDKLREVEAVPGSAFLIRKEVFEKVGRFDEKFFLFFEESDLGKRVREAGGKIFINPKAQVQHFRSHGQKGDKATLAHFKKSRFYYFKKHYGIFWALVVEAFARFSKKEAIFLLVLLLGAFLRLYRLEENFIFSGEVGHNFLAIKNAIISRQLPLLGPPTSHPWLYFGPLFYWILGPFLWIGNFDPLIGGYFGASIGVLVILLNYLVVKRIFGDQVALFSSFLIAISPLWLGFTREARFFSFVLPFIYLFLWACLKKKFFLLGLALGLMLNFHYTPLVFIPVILSLIKTGYLKLKMKQGLAIFTGFLIPGLPLLIHDVMNRFEMLANFLAWIPYRVAGFIGLYPKNTVTLALVKENFVSFFQFFNLSFLPEGNLLTSFLLVIAIIFIAKKIRQPLILLWLGWGMLALFIHGAPPIHYFLPLFPLPIIIFSLFLADLRKRKLGKIVVYGLLIVISFINLNFFFSVKWFFLPQDRIWPGTFYVPYKLQKEIVRVIVDDATGRSYTLLRVGPYDYFEGNYAQNYQYLAWWFGNEPIQEEARLRYTIYENQTKMSEKSTRLFDKAEIVVVKEEE